MLLLDNYFFPVISINANPHYNIADKGTRNSAAIDINGNFGFSDDDKTCTAVLSISVKSPDEKTVVPYEIDITAVGSFRLPDNISPSDLGNMATIFCFSILYTSAREMVVSLTGRGPWPAVLLPVHTFQTDDLEDAEVGSKKKKHVSTKKKILK